MRAGSAIASSGRHVAGMALQALLIVAIVAALVFAAAIVTLGNPAGATDALAGRVVATIEFDSSTARTAGSPSFADSVGFRVDAQVSKDSDLYLLWVANKCYQGGKLVSVEYLPVKDAHAGEFTLGPAPMNGGPQGNWSSGAATCKSYVWMYPDTSKPIRGASMSYDVAP